MAERGSWRIRLALGASAVLTKVHVFALMTGVHRDSLIQHDGKDIPQFALEAADGEGI